MNKAISTPIAIIIVLIVFTISIGFILLGYICWPKEEVVLEVVEEFCMNNKLEDCDGKKVEIVGTLKLNKAIFLCDIEDRQVEYVWLGNCILIDSKIDLNNFYNKKVSVVGAIYASSGERCGLNNNEQCAGEYYPTTIGIEKVSFLEENELNLVNGEIVITDINYPEEFIGIFLNLNFTDKKMSLLSEPSISNGYPDYLPGSYEFMVRVVSFDGDILGEYGFHDPRIILAEQGYNGPTWLDDVDFIQIIPYFQNAKTINIFSADAELMLSVDISKLNNK
jgi:hypothetical protein